MRLSPALIDPVDAVDSAREAGAPTFAPTVKITLTFDPDDDLPDINGDHRAIKQMTFNLITNSIKFTDAGGEIRVDCAAGSLRRDPRRGQWHRHCA